MPRKGHLVKREVIYNGKIINKPSTPMVTGRYLPNALLVKKK